jgi:hypothetical protein
MEREEALREQQLPKEKELIKCERAESQRGLVEEDERTSQR